MDIVNNNPGNIKKDAKFSWQGEKPGTTPGDFVIFDNLANGYRAMMKDFRTKIKRGVDTITKIITVWAPSSDDNDPASYITAVSEKTGIDPNATLKPDDVDTLGSIAYAMSFVEHNITADDGTLSKALTDAKNIIKGIVDKVTTLAKENPLPTAVLIVFGLWYLLSDNNKSDG